MDVTRDALSLPLKTRHEVLGLRQPNVLTGLQRSFLAVAPDLFWRQEPGVDLNVTSEADWQHGLRLYGAYDRDAGAKDVKDTVNAVRNLLECNGRVGVLG